MDSNADIIVDTGLSFDDGDADSLIDSICGFDESAELMFPSEDATDENN